MNEDIKTPEELIEEVESQALSEFDDCLDTMSVTYEEYIGNKNDPELEELYNDAIVDLKTLLGDYAPEDDSIIQEAFDILFDKIKSDISS